MHGKKSYIRDGQGVCVLQQLPEATWLCCNGSTSTTAPGMEPRAQAQPEGATLRSCSGRDRMGAVGVSRPAPRQLKGATWQCCSGRTRTTAPGMKIQQ